MSSENNEMVVQDQYGLVCYNRSVFSSIARNVIDETDQMEVAESNKMFRSGHVTTIDGNRLFITIPVRIAYGANVTDLCAHAQSKIYESIEYMTGYRPESIELQVVGFIF